MAFTGADLIARSLIANGITHAFNVPGLGIHPLLHALKQHPEIKYFTAPSETAVSLMADGYGRATRRPALVNVYHASGTALGMMGVTTAWGDRSPMVFTTTTSSTKLARRDQYASVPADITETTRQFTKWHWEVPSVDRIPEAISRAVIMATTPPMGPVHLAFPMDLYTAPADESLLQNPLADPKRLRVFNASGADPAGITRAVEMLCAADRPVIVAGGDVAQYRAIAELSALAEMLNAPVFSEPFVAYMGFPNNHRLFAGRFSPHHKLVKEADVALVIGAEFTDNGSGREVMPPPSLKTIVMTTDPLEVGKQIWADAALIGHPKTALAQLNAAMSSAHQKSGKAWASVYATEIEAYRSRVDADSQVDFDAAPLSLPRLIKETQRVFGDAIVVDHSTTGAAHMLQMYEFSDPTRYYGISARASAQGWGVPAAIGIQIAQPNERVIVFVGDGGFMFTSSGLYAASLFKLPLVIVLLNNGGWYDVAYGARKNRGWTDADIKNFGWECDPPIDYAGFATSLGVEAIRVVTPAELPPALERAKASKGPVLLDVATDPKVTEYYLAWLNR